MAAACGEAEAGDGPLLSEVEVLESIYLDELQVLRGNGRSVPWEISITLHPATAEDQNSQYVCFTLVLSLPPQYPNEAPKISIRNPRGLSDEQTHKISQTLEGVTQARLGSPMLYELIEKGKEILTDNNIPHGQCVICLYGFKENEAFTKTACYHYFHSHCLASYIEHMEKEIHAQREEKVSALTALPKEEVEVQCPVCRKPLVYDLAALQAAPPPQQPLEMYHPDTQMLLRRQQLHLMYQRQQEKGGIINPEEEKNRYFISLQKPSGAVEGDQAALFEKFVNDEKDLNPPPADSGNTLGNAEAVPVRNDPDKTKQPPVAFYHHSKRERIRGGKTPLHRSGWQTRYGTAERPVEANFALAEESDAFNRRPHWRKDPRQWGCGGFPQESSNSFTREPTSSLTDRKEPGTRDSPPVKEGLHSVEQKSPAGYQTPVPPVQAQGGEEETPEVRHGEPRESPTWNGQRDVQDCRHWGKPKIRGRGSYSKMPRGRGWYRSHSREPQGQEAGEDPRR